MQQVADWLETLGLGQYARRLPRTTSAFPSCLISRIKTSRTLGCRSVIDASCCVKSPISTSRQPRPFEDAHWADPTSLEVFSRVVDRLRNFRVLLIVTFRPEFDPPWIGRPYVTALTLNRLAQRDIETVIDNVVGNKLIPASIRQDIIERTDGIPLFVEEMTKAVLEAGSEVAAQRTVASGLSPSVAVPASLQASLMTARPARLGQGGGTDRGRHRARVLLCLLAAVVRKPEAELTSALDRLIAAGLLFRQGVPTAP
jgi:hypothetical protein